MEDETGLDRLYRDLQISRENLAEVVNEVKYWEGKVRRADATNALANVSRSMHALSTYQYVLRKHLFRSVQPSSTIALQSGGV